MPDLNELLRWSIANSVPRDVPSASTQQTNRPDQTLSLRFRPTTDPSAASSTLHSSDPQYRLQADDASPASTPGPATPIDGSSALPGMAKRNDLTSEMLDLIMGKSDSVVMKEKMAIAVDESRDVDERVEALDDFEMLIELIDNANNMAVLKLWEPLLGLLESSESEIVTHAAWIIGTAVQNNLKAQAALYIHGALSTLLSLIYPSPDSPSHPTSTRGKATYAFSSSVKHWPLASAALSANSSQGYSVLRQGVSDSEPVIRRKIAFLIGTLVMQSGETYTGEIPNEVRNLIEERMKVPDEQKEGLLDGLRREGVFLALAQAVKESSEDIEFEENAMRALSQAASRGALSGEEKAVAREVWKSWGSAGQEERGLGGDDAAEINKIFV